MPTSLDRFNYDINNPNRSDSTDRSVENTLNRGGSDNPIPNRNNEFNFDIPPGGGGVVTPTGGGTTTPGGNRDVPPIIISDPPPVSPPRPRDEEPPVIIADPPPPGDDISDCLDIYNFGEVLWDRVFQWKDEVHTYFTSQVNARRIAAFSDIAIQTVIDYENVLLTDGTRYKIICTGYRIIDFLCDVTSVQYYYFGTYNLYAAKYNIQSPTLVGEYYVTSGGKLCKIIKERKVDEPDPGFREEPPVVNPPGRRRPPLGSGEIFIPIPNEDMLNFREMITGPLWSKGEKYLMTPYSGSTGLPIFNGYNVGVFDSVNYYLDVYNSNPLLDECSEIQFRIIYADYEGRGAKDLGGLDNETVSKAMYTQYSHILLPKGTDKFIIDGVEQDYVYIIDVKRDRYRDAMDPGNWQLTLPRCQFSNDSGSGGAYGDSILDHMMTASMTTTNYTFVDTATRVSQFNKEELFKFKLSNQSLDVKLGTIELGVGYTPTGSIAHVSSSFGLFYPNHGMIVLSGEKLDTYLQFNTNRNIDKSGFNTYRLFHSIRSVTDNNLTDASGDPLGFWGRYMQIKYNKMYFIRVKNQILNYTNNPTYTTGSEGLIAEELRFKEFAYFNSVGLYNKNRELLAVGKLSTSLISSPVEESLFTVKIGH